LRTLEIKAALFRSKIFLVKISHRIFGHMYGALNIDKIKKPIEQFACKLRNESFESVCDMI